MGAEFELSAPRQNVGLWYDVPLDPPLTDKLRVAGGYQAEDLANTDSSSRLLTFGPEWHSKTRQRLAARVVAEMAARTVRPGR